ncbi:hypothetical protein M8818_003471 [Zalaria obscura]|uniref:Uncharacterized protein n=1 Tax=Zalaria obscura TaxID=2024903 RepID=A0ACC3SEC6_9PEZI
MPENYEITPLNPPSEHRLSTSSRSSIDSFDERHPLQDAAEPYSDFASTSRPTVQSPEPPRRRVGWRRWLLPNRKWCYMVLLFIVATALLLLAGGITVWKSGPTDGQSPPFYPSPLGGTVATWQESYAKAAKLVQQMTLVEKVNLTTGTGWSQDLCVGNTGPVPRLGFPSLCLQDGPLGLRFSDHASAFPAGITVGATWNKTAMYLRGRAHGAEARGKGINVLLGPSMGPLGRLPAGGRNWEGFGSDPVLQGVAAAETIKGIQEEGVIATAKHYVGNEQEHFRQPLAWLTKEAISSNMDDRTLHEVYGWPFADSIRAGVASVMCSYNQVNNSYACQNSKLLNRVLKDEMGFQGFVQSDWLAQRSGVASALAGLDMSMPGDGIIWADGKSLWGSELTKAVLNTSVPVERINDMALRIVAAWYKLGQDDKTKWPAVEDGGGPNFSSWTDDKVGLLHPASDDKTTAIVNKFVDVQGDHAEIARHIAAEGIVLVKNEEDLLPLSRNGSSLERRDGAKLKIGIFGESAFANPDGNNACDDRGCNVGALAMGWGSGAVELPYLITPAQALHASFDNTMVEVSDFPTNDVKAESARDQDLCMVFITSDAGEGFIFWDGNKGDRNDLNPQKGGDDLVKKVAANCGGGNAPVVVVLHAVGPTILEKWIEIPNVHSVLLAHLPGQESGSALASIIFGDVNPSGHLPYTVAKKAEDYGPSSGIMYYANNFVAPQQNFSEGIFIDYRYFDAHNITPRYPFGHGLSYTKFHLSSLFIHPYSHSHTSLPAARPSAVAPPTLPTDLPSVDEAIWPKGWRKLHKYIYPYLASGSSIKKGKYPYPKGYDTPFPPSPAGGAEGGNPSLFDPAVSVQASLTNMGSVPGDCVVQLYLGFPANLTNSLGEAVEMPPRVLRGWEKVYVGTSNREKRVKVEIVLMRRDVSFWDRGLGTWVWPEGSFKVWLGYSSRDLEAMGRF